ncbi:MAG: peptide ABC transporter substrate-binding protein [Alphaproteobacteria bacterium]|nr:peptide ABC transporter substrate-binding protein [Alphaproteobacteria bacterium]
MKGWDLAAASAALAAVLTLAAPALAQKSGGTLRVYHRDSPASMSILEEATISTVMPMMPVFNNLVLFDQHVVQNSLNSIVPDLAESWAWNDGGTELTFKLRDGVKWHDGKPFTAADVKCTFDLLTGKGTARLRVNPRKSWYENLTEVTVNGDHEAVFHLKRKQPALLTLLASGFSPIYPCHIPPAQMRQHPIGTGPFKFVEFKPNESIKVVRNPDYWKPGRPYLEAIEYTVVTNRSTAVLAFIAGKFDLTFTAEITVPLMKQIKEQVPQDICDLSSTNNATNLLVNRDKPPFDNPDIRRAMMLTIDRNAFRDIIGEGQGDIGGAMLPPSAGLWGLPPEILKTLPGYDPDVEKSRAAGRAIMEKLGYGPDKRLAIKVATRNIATYRDPAVILIDQLKNIYIDAELDPVETANWYPKLARKDYQVGLNITGSAVDDPDQQFYENYSCGSERNYTGYCNQDLQKSFDQQSMESDQDKRRKLVWDIDRQLQEDAARPIIMHNRAATCWQPQLKGLTIMSNSIFNGWRMEDVWLDRQ